MWIRIAISLVTAFSGSAVAESPDFTELIEFAERHEMPFPPEHAELVLVHSETWTVLGNRSNSRDPAFYKPGFRIGPGEKETQKFLVGATFKKLQPRAEPLHLPFSTEEQEPKPGGYLLRTEERDTIATAVQCAARGDLARAEELWSAFARPKFNRIGDVWRKKVAADEAVSLLADNLFQHHFNRLNNTREWAPIQRRLDALVKERPDLITPTRADALRDLKLAVETPPAEPGSVEALLVRWSRVTRNADMRRGISAKSSQAQILRQGLAAVPELRKLVGDTRLTNQTTGGFMKAPIRRLRLGELADELLVELLGKEKKIPLKVNEAKFFADRIFERKRRSITGVHETPALVIAHRFPEHLRGLCEEFASRAKHSLSPHVLADGVATSTLSKDEARELLTDFTQRGPLKHRRAYLQTLAELHPERCAPLVIPNIQSLPKDLKRGEEYWTSETASMTHVVMWIGDEQVWREYLKKAKSCSVGLRMEMMNPMNYLYIEDRNRKLRIAFLAAFLDDAEVRKVDDGKKWQGPHAGFTIDVLSVRDFAAMNLGHMLDVPGHPDEFWGATQWAAHRKAVAAKLATLDLPTLE